ncbi:hypothetical protein [Crocinitomix algicola]|uniref:hypothetical protein n=1 Tax=Crocinitomix algicola TaxID=1740263 RepID=UPI000872F00F|nr:hypothetical protein [Crocinitomix algicola]
MILLEIPLPVIGMLILIGGPILIFVFVIPFYKGYKQGMDEMEKNKHLGIKVLRKGKKLGFKNFLLVCVMVICLLIIFTKNLNDINPNQHIVNKSDGTSFTRTNPNSTKNDNIGKNTFDIFIGSTLLIIGGIVVFSFMNKK